MEATGRSYPLVTVVSVFAIPGVETEIGCLRKNRSDRQTRIIHSRYVLTSEGPPPEAPRECTDHIRRFRSVNPASLVQSGFRGQIARFGANNSLEAGAFEVPRDHWAPPTVDCSAANDSALQWSIIRGDRHWAWSEATRSCLKSQVLEGKQRAEDRNQRGIELLDQSGIPMVRSRAVSDSTTGGDCSREVRRIDRSLPILLRSSASNS